LAKYCITKQSSEKISMFSNNANGVRMLTKQWLTGVQMELWLEGRMLGPRLMKAVP